MSGLMMNKRLTSNLILPLVLVLLLGAAGHALAQQQPSSGDFQRVTWMEEAIFKTEYRSETIDDRLSRLEDVVFGEANHSESPEKRVQNLHEALMARKKVATPQKNPAKTATHPLKAGKQPMPLEKDPLPPLNPVPKELNAPIQPATGAVKPSGQPAQTEPLPDESDYPALAIMEQRVFGRHYEGEGLDPRLDRIERKVLGMPQRGPYYARVDNLRLVVLGDTAVASDALTRYGAQPPPHSTYFPGIPPQQAAPYTSVNTGQTAPTATPGQPGQTNYGTGYPQYPMGGPPQTGSYGAPSHPNVAADVANALTSVEDQILGKTYPMEPNSQRLDRLEEKIFNRTSPGISEEDRLQRVIAVASAEGKGREPNGVTTGGAKSTVKSLWPLIPFIILMLL